MIREGAGGKVFPLGRWNRDQGHRLEVVNDGPASWFECSCGAQGPLRHEPGQADTDAENHERDVYTRAREGGRFVRGRWE